MSTQIKSYELPPIFIQAGYGIPDHISSLGSEYTDLYTALKYVNKDGLAYWVQMVDSTYTGSTFTGGIVTGPTIFTAGLTANTISATTYYGSSSGLTGINHYYVSGSTPVATLYDGDRWFDTTNGIEFVYLDDGNSSQWIEPNPGLITALISGGTGGGATFSGGNVTGFSTFLAGLASTSVSATNYYGLPLDIYVTGGTYSSGTLTFKNSSGGTFTIPGFNTGGTITGSTFFSNGLSANTISATTYLNLPIKYYAESSIAPSTSPVASGTSSVAIGNAAKALGNNILSLGSGAGNASTGNSFSTFVGYSAGYQANSASSSNFFGYNSGNASTGITFSNFIGSSGIFASNINYSNFIGASVGYQASNIDYSNFIGYQAGYQTTNADNSNFIGNNAGYGANNADNSNFIGQNTGYQASGSYFSNLFGYNVGKNVVGSIGPNNIIIGTNISLPPSTSNAINIGGVLFGTGTNNTIGATPILTPNNGKIGINVVTPSEALHVSGNTLINGNLTANTISATTYLNYPSVSGLYLPLSGGTVFGPTKFTSSLTANTISATSINKVDYIVFNTGATVTNITGGTLYFDLGENALSYKPITNQNDVTVNLGQESLIRVYNNLGYQINNGQVLHITGSTTTGGTPTVALANASKLATTTTQGLAQTSGVATHDIPNGQYGFMTNFGVVRDINTSTFTAGDEIYLSDTVDGGLTNNSNNIALTSRVSNVGFCLESSPTSGKILVVISNENKVQSLTQKEVNVLLGNTISTGVFNFTGITLASSNTFNVAPVDAWFVDNTTNPLIPKVLYVNYSGQTNILSLYYNTATETYLLLTSAGTITQQTTFPTPQQRRQNVYLGKMGHGNKTSLINAFNEPDLDISPLSQFRDMFTPIKLINENVYPSPNTGLTFNTSSGTVWGLGIGFITNQLNPNSLNVSGNSSTTFQYRTQTGGTATNITTIIPGSYDLNGVITTIGSPAKQATNQRIYLLQNGQFRIQYGQTIYSDLTTAISAVNTESFTTFSNFRDNAVLIAILSIRSDASLLSDIEQAKFTFASKFGEAVGGTGGISTTTLQQAYNNSSNPEILTNSTLGGLSIKNGTGNADATTNLLEGLNTAGNTTSFIRADGLISGITLQTSSVTANNTGLNATIISATTYQNLPIKYYAEFSAAPVTSPIVLSGNSIAIGDGAQARNINMFVVGNSAGQSATGASNSNFIGYYTGYQATGATHSNFLGNSAGYGATGASYSNFIGQQAGQNASAANGSNFFSQNAGYGATNANNSNFFGVAAGQNATNANNSNFFGNSAGQSATGASYSNFFGYQAGQNATGAVQSNFLGGYAGYQATAAQGSNFLGYQAGYQATGASFSNFLGGGAGYLATGATLSNFIGNGAGNGATDATGSNFLGQNAGRSATNAFQSNFIGQQAGYQANGASASNFLGQNAGYLATGATLSNFLGQAAGSNATGASNSNFFGLNAGRDATAANNSNFIGQNAGNAATGASNSNFFGQSAGNAATSASNSNFMGYQVGYQATGASNSNFMSYQAGYQANNASNSNFMGYQAGYQATGASTSNFIGQYAGYQATGSSNSNFLGNQAGQGATNAGSSNFLNDFAGYGAINAFNSNFLGSNAGYLATGASNSNFLGLNAGRIAISSTYSNFIGNQAGYLATGASNSNFIGGTAGYRATNATGSNFIGSSAGYSATGSTYSTFIGSNAGYQATGSSYSNLIGFQVGQRFVGNNIGSNNIIIGTNISLPNGTTNSLNIGGILFGSGTYSNTGSNPSITGQTNGRIGINVVTPSEALHVSGNTLIQGSLTANTISATTLTVPSVIANISGLTVNANTTITGTTFKGNGTFTKSGYASGDILLDNSGTDTPGILMYYGNNSNYGIDSWNGSYDVISGQIWRITNNLNESGGAVKLAIDTSGNMVVNGFVKANAWRAGQVINDIMLSNTDVTISTTTIATSTSDTDFLTYSYTPLSSSSYLVIHYHLASYSFEGGTGNDSYFSRIKVDGVEYSYSRQSTVNGNRTGVLFPLTARYTNSNTTAKSIVVACRRDSADDNITIVNTATSMWLRITEIARA